LYTLASLPGDGLALGLQNVLSGRSHCSREVFKFCEISNNVSETMQDRDIVTMEDK